jgi:hypothetical protein
MTCDQDQTSVVTGSKELPKSWPVIFVFRSVTALITIDYMNKKCRILSMCVKRNTEGHMKDGRKADIFGTMPVSDFVTLTEKVIV